jgi:phage-related tail fiber protein
MADYYTLLTNAGIAYENACKAAGVPIKLSQISVGDGNGAAYNPSATATALKREVWRGPLNALFQDEKNPSWLLAEVAIPPEVGGWYVREAGVWTDTGILYAIVKYPESFKPELATSGSGKEFYIRSIFETSNASLVTLLIDDTVVRATRAWVLSYLADELAKLDGKQSVRVATTANILLSGAQQIDGVAVVAGDRVAVVRQTAAKDNGIYVVANGAWARATDANTSAKVTPGMSVFVEEGAANSGSTWQLLTKAEIALGTTALVFEMLAGKTGIEPGSYSIVTVDKFGRAVGGKNPSTLAGHGITDTYTKPEIEEMVAKASSLPVGSMVAFPAGDIPPGFLEADGSKHSAAQYPALAAHLGTTFNKGDEGAGYFRLPDSRGEFLRGWDNGRGVDAGRALGSAQADAFKEHRHLGGVGSVWGGSVDPFVYGRTDVDTPGQANSFVTESASTGVNSQGYTSKAGDSETRPRNLAVMWCIKAWSAPVNQGNIDIAALAAQVAAWTPRNSQFGFIMSMDVVAPASTVSFSAGSARGVGNPVSADTVISCVLQGAGAWSPGSGGNKLDTGVRAASTWYHAYVLRKVSSGERDILLSISATPQVPAGYELVARLKGRSIKTDASGGIIPFINYGNSTDFKALQRDMRLTGGASRSTTVAVSAPPGVSVLTRHYAAIVAENGMILIRHPDADDAVLGPISNSLTNTYAGGIGQGNTGLNGENASGYCEARTNALGQVVAQVSVGGSYTVIEAWLFTQGWTEE